MPDLYNPSHYRVDDHAALSAFIHAHPFATLVSTGAKGLSVSHLPMILEAGVDDAPATLRGHIARANSHWQEIGEGIDALAIFHGPQAYVTPQWYPSKLEHAKVVPTWNYAVAHVHGHVRSVSDAAWLYRHVSALTARHESAFAHQWAVTDAPVDYVDKMLKAIVGLEMTVTRIEGKWKLSQNRAEPDRQGVVAGMAAREDANSQAVSELMRSNAR
ncbi:MAG: FMN-binding negative transcriptional regulator [Rhodospirillaceae bacterium]|nr:FMN-binding negative transcriptional regulator [Rhodospirillaceae bacterium]